MGLLEHLNSMNSALHVDVDAALEKAQGDVMAFLDQLKADAIRNPEPIFAALRRVKPILIIKKKNAAIVTRFADVQEVLSRDDVFQVTYREKMEVITGGSNFFLGMQNSPEYERDVAHMRSAIRRQDLESIIIPFVQQTADALVRQCGGSIDVVNQLSRVVPARLIAQYFGCVPPSDRELADWGTAIFQFLFTDLLNDPAVGEAARNAAVKARAWLEASIADRKAHPVSRDDVLGRCLALQAANLPGMDDLGIRNNLIGLLVGAIPTTSKCCAQALDQLLNRPEELERARQAALANDDKLLARYVFEALRFNPNNPGVFRNTAEDYTVAKGSLHAVTIPKGTMVVAATQSAMFDETVVDQPNEFRVDRPPYIYMHWGYGLHTCFGQYINQAQIPGILKPLLQCNSLRRAPGDAGQLKFEGPFPASLAVNFEVVSRAAGS